MAGSLEVVQVLRPLTIGNRDIASGARLLACEYPDGWHIMFNGRDIPVKKGVVGALDSPEVIRAIEGRASARDEEYSVAPNKK